MEERRLIELNLKRLGGVNGSGYMQAAQMRYRARRIVGRDCDVETRCTFGNFKEI